MVGEIPTQLCCTVFYRMAKINCHLNQYNACVNSLRYCALSRKPIELKIHSLQISYIRTTAAVRCDRVCNTKRLSCDICLLPCDIIIVQCDKKFQPYDKTVIASIPQKILALCNIKGEFVSSFSLNTASRPIDQFTRRHQVVHNGGSPNF